MKVRSEACGGFLRTRIRTYVDLLDVGRAERLRKRIGTLLARL